MRDRNEAELDDVTLIRRVASGDRGAFDVLVRRHWAPMHRYAAAAAHDPAAAEDALQDAFTAVWRSAGTFRGDVSGRAWLFTIARNALGHRLRRRAGEPDEMASLEDLGAAAGWGDTSSGDRVMAAIEDRDRVRHAMAALSAEDREVLILVDVEELTAEEAGAAMSLSVAALKSRLHRARLRLLAQLGKEEAMQGERIIGGIGCAEVLAGLHAFVDGTLAPEARERVVAHVSGCDLCARFGGTYAAVIARVRAAHVEPSDPAVLGRLAEKLGLLG